MTQYTTEDLRALVADIVEEHGKQTVADAVGKTPQAIGQCIKQYDSITKYLELRLAILANYGRTFEGPFWTFKKAD